MIVRRCCFCCWLGASQAEQKKAGMSSSMCGKTTRLITMLVLVVMFFAVELIMGNVAGCIALIADAFHMLSDALSIVVALIAIKLSKKSKTSSYTYGWARAEVLGALINSVFLLALCFSIFIGALKRLIIREEIKHPDYVLTVGVVGLVINVFGLYLFHSHSHQHTDASEDGESRDSSHSYLNIKGVFLHILGDALGSLAVIVSSLAHLYIESDLTRLIDPILSIIIVIIIYGSTMPLLTKSSSILLQRVPPNYDANVIVNQIKSQVSEIENIHDFHLWQLSGEKYISTAHIILKDPDDYKEAALKIKAFLHEKGIHSSTIQPEYMSYKQDDVKKLKCLLDCNIADDGCRKFITKVSSSDV